MARLVCSGDWHVGAGLDLAETPELRLLDQEQVGERIADLANELGCPLLFGGDAWERRKPTPAELLAVRRPFERLKYASVGVVGNHDVEGFGRPNGYDVFAGGKMEIHATPGVVSCGGAAIGLLPWAPPSRLVALEGGGDRDELNVRLAAGLVAIARQLYTEIDASFGEGIPRVLLAHWSVGSSVTPTGAAVDLFREPVILLEDLQSIGFDAIVLSHIHKPQVLGDPTRPIFYTGSPSPLNFGEADGDHVAWILDVERGGGQVYQVPIDGPVLKSYDLFAREIGPSVGIDMPLDYDGAIVKVRIRSSAEQAARLDVGAIKRQIENPTAEIASGPAPRARKVWAIQVDADREAVVRGVEIDETIDDEEAFALWLQESGLKFDTDRWGDLLDLHNTYSGKAAT